MAARKRLDDRSFFQQGLRKVEANLNREIEKIRGRSRKRLFLAAGHIAGKASARAPVDKGDLRGSVVVRANHRHGPAVDASNLYSLNDAYVVFEAPYAAAQHEHVEYNHPRGGEAKYLEKTLLEEQDAVLRIIGGDDNA